MRILGIDPGSRVSGYGLIDVRDGEALHVASGIIPLKDECMAARLCRLQEALRAIIVEHRPQRAAIESVFVQKNPNSALKLGQARGVILCTLAMAELPIFEYAPRAVKLAVAGHGGADKKIIQECIQARFHWEGKLQADRADALAIALTHWLQEDP